MAIQLSLLICGFLIGTISGWLIRKIFYRPRVKINANLIQGYSMNDALITTNGDVDLIIFSEKIEVKTKNL